MGKNVCRVCVWLSTLFAVSGIIEGSYRICYYTNWSQYAKPEKFFPETIDTSLCSHVLYAFAKLQGNRLAATEWNDESTDFRKGMYERVNDLKNASPHLKTLVSVGGWGQGTANMSRMLSTKESRKEFVDTSIIFLRTRDFDGLDLHFQYPAHGDSPAEDKQRFTALCRELKSAFEKEAQSTGKPRLVLAAAVGATKDIVDKAYEVAEITKWLDIISIMTYTFHGAWEPYTGHHAALYPRSQEPEQDKLANMNFSANYWVSQGARKSQITIGMTTNGSGRKLVDRTKNGMGAPAVRDVALIPTYGQVCVMLATGATRVWHAEHQVPYTHRPESELWVSYDDVQSLTNKVAWLKQNGFSGWMSWSLASDDFVGRWCDDKPYPLHRALSQAMDSSPSSQ